MTSLIDTDVVRVVELFASIQGEGITQGRHAVFVRFPLCNLRCDICDTKYTWNNDGDDQTPTISMTAAELAQKIVALVGRGNRVVFTGGEPLLPKNLDVMLYIMAKLPTLRYEIETNGSLTVPPAELAHWKMCGNVTLNISPKGNVPQVALNTHTKKMCEELPLLKQVVRHGMSTYIVKTLVRDQHDVVFTAEIQKRFDIPSDHIFAQPVGEDIDSLLATARQLFNIIIGMGWSLSPRLHILLFGKKRNV